MGFGLTFSVLLHVGVLAWALINFQSTPPLKLPEEIPVEVSIITDEGLTRIMKGNRDSKIVEAALSPAQVAPTKEAAKPKPIRVVEPPPPAASEPPPPAETVKVEPPKPAEPPKPDEIAALIEKSPAPPPPPDGPTPEEKKLLEEKLAEQQRLEDQKKAEAEAKKRADDKKKADDKKRADDLAKKKLADDKKKKDDAARKAAELAKKKQFDASQIADLLNKVPDQPSAAAGAQTPPAKATAAKGPVAGAPEGRDSQNSAAKASMMSALIRRTYGDEWDISCGTEGITSVVIKVQVKIKPDGMLFEPPRVVSSGSGPLFDTMKDAALRAIKKAEPVTWPPDLYKGGWDAFIATFDARQRCQPG